ncbi:MULTISPECIES: CotS family spore coat protein [Clostridium]|uniref:CotS family spore coat protein n=1 Tax=Clostridium TaxID=1485 RepID=UPI0021533501|nr:CotS family spore coat protein [Clostridium sp. LY3-2]MCR6516120.1 CotS family spore coat protein [Clostridium sp. LY3-2]
MNRVRYAEKKYLCKYDLSKEFFDSLGICPLDITPLRKVYLINTKSSKKILKKVDYDKDKINFINKSLEYINKTFENTIKFQSIQGKPYLRWKDENYILMDVLEGREATINNILDVELCMKALKRLHKASEKIVFSLESEDIKIFKGDNLIYKFEEIENDLVSIKDWVTKSHYKNEFDNLFLELSDSLIEDVKRAKEMIWVSNYEKLINDKENLVLSHNDLAHHNFLIKGEEVSIIDFDYSNIDLRALDVSDFILKWIKNNVFDIVKAKAALEAYEGDNPLSEDEYKIIYINLSYSKDLYSIIKSYYHKEKEWDYNVFLNRLLVKIENDKYRREFLVQFKEYLIHKLK